MLTKLHAIVHTQCILRAVTTWGDEVVELWNSYSEIVSAVLGFLAGCAVTVVVTRVRQGKAANYANQSGSTVGRDQAGRDIRR